MKLKITSSDYQRVHVATVIIATVVWAGIIFYLSSIPGSGIPQAPSIISFLVHFFEYTVLGALLGMCVHVIKKQWHNQAVIYAFMIGSIYAFSDEFHQHFVPGRSVDPMDILIDIIGLVTGMFVVALHLHHVHISLVDSKGK